MRRISASLMLVVLLLSLFPLLLITIYSPGSYIVEGIIVLLKEMSYAFEQFLRFVQTMIFSMNLLT